MLKTLKTALLTLGAFALLASPLAAAQKISINAAAGNQGGVFYVGMGAVGKAIMDDCPDIDYSMFPSAGFTNIMRVQLNQSQIGVAQSINSYMGMEGLPPFKAKQDKVLGIVSMNTRAHTHIVVTEASGIQSLRDIKDKKLPVRININPKGGNNELMPRFIFEAYGLGWDEIKAQGGKLFALSIPDAIDMMKDGRIDVDVYHGEEPAYKYTDIMSSTKIRILPIDEDKLEAALDKIGGGCSIGEFSPTAYGGLAKGIRSLRTSTELVVNADLPDELVYRLTKAILNHREDIATAVPLWGSLAPETAPNTSIPLHPGAIKYYKEIGVLK